MILSSFEATDVRCLVDLSVAPHPTLNLITGNNGTGKSSILEAIQCLATGHTFRTRRPRELMAHNAPSLRLTAKFYDERSEREYRVGCERLRDGSVNFRLNFEDIKSQAEIARLMPVKVLSPESHQLVQDGPEERRRFLDWGLFHVKPRFMPVWGQYKRSLSQRNQLLRESALDKDIDTWNSPLLAAGLELHQARTEFTALLNSALQRRWGLLNEVFHVELSYRPGWDVNHSLETALTKNLTYHRRMKTTTDGPHRAELTIKVDDKSAKQVLSRGQQKTLVYVLHLSQLDVLKEAGIASPMVLCDDLSSELDENHTNYLVDQLHTLESQLFVTGVDLSVLTGRPCKEFHMQGGIVKNGL